MNLIQVRIEHIDRRVTEQIDLDQVPPPQPELSCIVLDCIWRNLELVGLPRPTVTVIPEGADEFLGVVEP